MAATALVQEWLETNAVSQQTQENAMAALTRAFRTQNTTRPLSNALHTAQAILHYAEEAINAQGPTLRDPDRAPDDIITDLRRMAINVAQTNIPQDFSKTTRHRALAWNTMADMLLETVAQSPA